MLIKLYIYIYVYVDIQRVGCGISLVRSNLSDCFGYRSNTWSFKWPQDGSEGDERHGMVQTS